MPANHETTSSLFVLGVLSRNCLFHHFSHANRVRSICSTGWCAHGSSNRVRYRGQVRSDMDCPICSPLSSSFVTHWADRVDRRVRQMTKWKVNELIKKKWTSIFTMETSSVFADVLLSLDGCRYKVLLPAILKSPATFRWKSFSRDALVGLAKCSLIVSRCDAAGTSLKVHPSLFAGCPTTTSWSIPIVCS